MCTFYSGCVCVCFYSSVEPIKMFTVKYEGFKVTCRSTFKMTCILFGQYWLTGKLPHRTRPDSTSGAEADLKSSGCPRFIWKSLPACLVSDYDVECIVKYKTCQKYKTFTSNLPKNWTRHRAHNRPSGLALNVWIWHDCHKEKKKNKCIPIQTAHHPTLNLTNCI